MNNKSGVEVKYEIKHGGILAKCTTKCFLLNNHTMVGSNACVDCCPHFISEDEEKQVVLCGHPNLKKNEDEKG